MNTNPLAEVFGFPTDNFSNNAERYRKNRLCPFHNKVPSCTKNSATNPLGVCSIFYINSPVITCPIRFTLNLNRHSMKLSCPNQESLKTL